VAALTLVLGGVRSGKSRQAEQIALAHPPVTYLATARAGDAEMAARIAEHQRRRAAFVPAWSTVEEAWDIAAVVAAQRTGEPGGVSPRSSGCLLLEDLGLWLTNLLLGLPGRQPCDDAEVRAEVARLLAALESVPGRVIVVSPEAGSGVVPVNALARRFTDLLGEANQRLAAAASEVFLCVAGIPVAIKHPGGGTGAAPR
jgi:adenosylcobinamide kinase / adenosylcobinamide-phosphate guanylyltransferase